MYRIWNKEHKIYDVNVWLGQDGDLYYTHSKSNRLNPLFALGNYTVELSTGLLDKNGKEIYEGDIVIYKYADRYGSDSIVDILSDPMLHLLCEEKTKVGNNFKELYGVNYCEDDFYSTRSFDVEVIGNIHDE